METVEVQGNRVLLSILSVCFTVLRFMSSASNCCSLRREFGWCLWGHCVDVGSCSSYDSFSLLVGPAAHVFGLKFL